MIEVKNLYKSFEEKEVLKGISTVFEDGKINLIIGKTVLMKNLVGLFEPTSGQILYDGRDFVHMTKKEKVMMRREMGMIFQAAALFDSLTVLENVMFPLDMFSNMTYRERKQRAMYCLERVNLVGAENKYPGEISGGMQKRVAIARAISHPRHELGNGYWREHRLYLRGSQRVAGQLQPDYELDQQAPHRLHLRQRPAEGNERSSYEEVSGVCVHRNLILINNSAVFQLKTAISLHNCSFRRTFASENKR